MAHARKYSRELLDRGTRLVFESGRPVVHVAKDLGIESETLRNTSGRAKLTRAGAKTS
jgi:transposase